MELKDKFCLAFFPISRIVSLPRVTLDFEQYEKESIGAAWARFSMLIHAGPDLCLPDSVLLLLFCLGLDIEAALYLDMTIRGSFTHKTTMKQKKILAYILEKHASSVVEPKPLQKKGMSSSKEPSLVGSKSIPSLGLNYEPSPEPRTPKETMLHPSKFPIKFEDYGNTSKYRGHEKLTHPPEEVSPKIPL